MIKTDGVSYPETFDTYVRSSQSIMTPDTLTYPEIIVPTAQDLGKSAETIDAQIALRNVLPYSSGLDAPNISITNANSPFNIYGTNSTIFLDTSSWNITVNLPTAIGIMGKRFTFRKIDSGSNTITINAFGSENIDWSATKTVDLTNPFTTLVSDGINFYSV